MDTRTQIDPPSLPLLRRASTLIAMGTVGLALVAAAPASADPVKPVTKDKAGTTTTLPPPPGGPVYRPRPTLNPVFSPL